MTILEIGRRAADKDQFRDLKAYLAFALTYLQYVADNNQAKIVSQNENNYFFYQYDKSGNFQITRPLNSDLMLSATDLQKSSNDYLKILQSAQSLKESDTGARSLINNITYTLQQSIGAALDGLPAGESNRARKLNGDLFEHLIRLIINRIGINCRNGTIQIPIEMAGEEPINMSYQHDLIVEKDDSIHLIGSIKTSSKDRIDKIFMDKFLYNKLTETETPHIAIFLNDVQRKNTRNEKEYGINSTFLPGHFKGYTVKLNPLDGVYYCDIRPNMKSDNLLKRHIKTFDNLLTTDIWKFL